MKKYLNLMRQNSLRVRVDVWVADIENGVPRNDHLCPLAFAIQRAVGDNCSVSVTPTYAHTTSSVWTSRKGKLPIRARVFAWWFDRYPKLVRMVCPSFTFTLKLHE